MRPLRKRWRLRIGDWTTCPDEDRGTVPSVTLPMTALHGGQNSGPGEVVMRRRAIQTMGFTFGMTVTVKDAAGTVVPSPPLPTTMAHDVFRYVRHVPYHPTIYSIHTGTCFSRSSPC